jgi:hypothetical protein
MPQQPIPAVEEMADVAFPRKGLDLTHGFESQPPLTAIQGVNVRTFETETDRARGGSRPNLSQFIPQQLPNGAHLIQHLNYIVDPQAEALLANDDVMPPTINDPSDNPPGSNPNDPNDPRVRNRGRVVRVGGSGVAPNRNIKIKQHSTIQFIQSVANSYVSIANPTLAYSAQVAPGSLLIASVWDVQPPITPGVSDNLGTPYALAGQVTVGGIGKMSLFYGKTVLGGACTLTYSSNASPYLINIGLLEYANTKSAPFDGASTNYDLTRLGTWTTGLIPVTAANDLAVVVFASQLLSFQLVDPTITFSQDASLTQREHVLNRDGGLQLQTETWWLDNTAVSVPFNGMATATYNSLIGTLGANFIGVGATFKAA